MFTALSPVLLNLDETYQPQGGSFPTLLNLFFHMTMLDDLPIIGKYLPSTQHTGLSSRFDLDLLSHKQSLIDMDWVGGTAMMVSRKALDTFGLLDQNIFMYGEDVEICIRAKHHHFQVAIDPTAQITHLQNASSSSENAIKGEFKGWEGETVVRLTNGQIWQQTEYYYYYRYAYMPEVLIYNSNNGIVMKVDGIDKAVRVQRLK